MPEQHYQEDSSPIVRVEVVDHLPQGRRVARFEAEHETVIAVVNSPENFAEFLRQLEGVLQEAVESDTWRRNLSCSLQDEHPTTSSSEDDHPQDDPPPGN